MRGLQAGFTYTTAQTLLHRGGMLLIDDILDYEAEAVRCRVRVRRDSTFCGDDGVPAWVGLEYMAQAMSVYSGIELLQRGQQPRIGLLIGTRHYESSVPAFSVGSALEVRARVMIWEDDGLLAFDCAIHESGRRLAWGEVKGYRPLAVQEFLKR